MDDRRYSDSNSDPDSDYESHRSRTLELGSDFLKGAGPGRRLGTRDRYEFLTDPGGRNPRSTAMIMDTSKGRFKHGVPVGEAVFRFDRPHPGANYPHVNINPKISGRPDPHYRVPSSVVEAAPKAAKFLSRANKVALPVAVAMDGYRLWSACEADRESGDQDYTRTKTEAAGVAGGWAGAGAGGFVGAEMGTLVCPGIGTIAGGVAGAIVGGVAGDSAGRALTGPSRTRRCPECGRDMSASEQDELYCQDCE